MNLGLFKNRNFLLLWSSQILSQFAINIMNFLVLVQIFEQTGSTIASSFVWIAYGIPAILLGPIAAASVDMNDKRKILVLANLGQAVIILFYAFLYRQFLYLSYGVVLAYSILDQFYVPAESASLPTVIKKENLSQANGLFFISAQSSAVIGFGLAGLARETFGFTLTMLFGSFLLLIAFAATLYLPYLPPRAFKKVKGVEGRIMAYLEKMREGVSFIKDQKSILYPFLFLILLQVFLVIIVVNLPAMAQELLKTTTSFIGVMTIVPAGAGAFLGIIFVNRLLADKMRKKIIVERSLLLVALAFMAMPLLAPVFDFWLGRFILVAAFFIAGFGFATALIPVLTFLQIRTPSHLLGRVFGNFWVLAYTATLIPVLFSATITEVLGVGTLLIVMSLVIFAIFIFSRVRLAKVLANV